MNREQTIEAIKVMQAWVDGKTIQYVYGGKWVTLEGSPHWSPCDVKYRIKPIPEIMHVVIFPDGQALAYRDVQSAMTASSTHEGTTIRKFVEVMEDEAEPAYDALLPAKMVVPPSVRPLLRPFMKGDKGKTQGGWNYEVIKEHHLTLEVRHSGSSPSRCYEMIHDKTGAAGPTGAGHQLLAPDGFL